MKSFLIPCLFIAILSHLVGLITPWWVFSVVVALVLFVIKPTGGRAFLIGFTAIFLTWLSYSIWLYLGQANIITPKIGDLFNGLSPAALILVMALIGGLIGGFAGWTGASIRRAIQPGSEEH
ncbi:MAG: hypothetical protein KDC57_04695 [Saprospiraceae bacterium]|nr:hypothetical protein [Saprospiraceae bacterium]